MNPNIPTKRETSSRVNRIRCRSVTPYADAEVLPGLVLGAASIIVALVSPPPRPGDESFHGVQVSTKPYQQEVATAQVWCLG